MVIAAFFTFLVNLGVNGGELRLYLFIGEILGWFAWHETIGRITVSIFRRLFNFLYRVVFDPAGAFLHRVAEKAGRNLSLCADGAGKKIQTWEKCLKHRGAVVYNQNMGRKSKTVKTECSRKGALAAMKVIKGKKRGKNIFLGIAVAVFTVYAFTMLIQQQVAISEKKQELASVKQQIQIQEIKNDELKNADGSDSKNRNYIDKSARTSLDFSKPGERVFVNIAGK